jgi:hypothetical protein
MNFFKSKPSIFKKHFLNNLLKKQRKKNEMVEYTIYCKTQALKKAKNLIK